MTNIDLARKRDLGRILDDSFALYRAHWRTLVTVAFAVVVPVSLLVYGIGFGWFTGGYDQPATGAEVRLEDLAPTFGGLFAQILVVVPLVTAMTVHVVSAASRGERPSAGAAIRAGLDDFALLLPAIALMFAGLILGFAALIVPGVFLAVRWAVVSQVVVLERVTGAAALARSFALTRGQGWFTFFVVLVVTILVGVFSAVFQLPLDAAGRAADTMLLPLLGQMLGTAIALPITATAYTLLYHSLLAGSGQAAASPAPAAGAPASGSPAPASAPRSIEGVPGTFGDGFAPPVPPAPRD